MLAAVLVLALPPVATAGAEEESNWMLVKVTAASEGAEVDLSVEAEVIRSGRDPFVMGTGHGGRYGSVSVWEPTIASIPPNGLSLTTSSEAGGLDVVVLSARDGFTDRFAAGFTGRWLEPDEVRAVLVFYAGARDGRFSWDLDVQQGNVDVEVRSGSGAGLLRVAEPEAEGTSVDSGFVGAGNVHHQMSSPDGLVGAFTDRCQDCRMSWSAPDERSGSFARFGADAWFVWHQTREGDPLFSGPAGDWSWTWEGLHAKGVSTRTIFGGYVPVGEDWVLFSEPAGPQIPVLEEPTDWMVASLTAGEDGAVVDSFRVAAQTELHRPSVYGVGSHRSSTSVSVRRWGPDSPVVRTTSEAGGVRVDGETPEPVTYRLFVFFGGGAMDPGERRSYLVFFEEGTLEGLGYELEVAGGDVELVVETGTGTHVVDAVEPGHDGIAAQAGPVATGSSEGTTNPDGGIVGDLAFDCDRCTMTWESPDGRSGVGEVERSAGWGWRCCGTLFSGPAGEWHWSWSGVQTRSGPALLAAYAVVGDLWTLFPT